MPIMSLRLTRGNFGSVIRFLVSRRGQIVPL